MVLLASPLRMTCCILTRLTAILSRLRALFSLPAHASAIGTPYAVCFNQYRAWRHPPRLALGIVAFSSVML